MKHKILLAFGIAVMSLGLFANLNLAAAQDGSAGLLISPVRVEMIKNPGESEQVTLTVENVTDLPAKVRAIVNDFEPGDDESGQPKILFDEDTSVQGNSFKTLVAEIGEVELAPRQKKEVPVDIVVPDNATAGGYYGVIRFTSANAEDGGNVALSASVGTIFLVTVPGDLTESLDIADLSAAKNGSTGRFFIGTGEYSVITRLINKGNIHVKPYGSITVTNQSGEIVETINFNDKDPRDNVLPGSVRKFENQLTGDYKYGKYTITTNIGYGNGNGLITSTTSFWVVPVWMVIVALVAFMAIIIGAILLYRRLSKSRSHKVKPRR